MQYKFLWGALCALIGAAPALAGQFVFPREGQSEEQQREDEYYCHSWATRQTGFDPTRPPPAQARQPAQAAPGSGARGALRGAGRAWVISEIAGGDSSDAMRAGALVGGVRGRHQSRTQQQTQASAQDNALQQDYLRARAACLEANGYTVK